MQYCGKLMFLYWHGSILFFKLNYITSLHYFHNVRSEKKRKEKNIFEGDLNTRFPTAIPCTTPLNQEDIWQLRGQILLFKRGYAVNVFKLRVSI